MATKNYGLGYREMGRAGCIALERAGSAKQLSHESVKKYSLAWVQFTSWAKEHNVKQMERISPDLVKQYGQELAQKVDDSEIKSSTAQDRVTAVNRVLHFAGRSDWKPVSSTKECGIAQRIHIREGKPDALDRNVYLERLASVASPRGVAICELARNLGLRSKEASLLDARKALQQSKESGFIRVKDGSKGGGSERSRSSTKASWTRSSWPHKHKAVPQQSCPRPQLEAMAARRIAHGARSRRRPPRAEIRIRMRAL